MLWNSILLYIIFLWISIDNCLLFEKKTFFNTEKCALIMSRLKNKWVFCLFVWMFFYSVVQADEAVSGSFHEMVKWSDGF